MLSVWIHGAHGLRSWVGLVCVEPPVYWIVVVFQCYPMELVRAYGFGICAHRFEAAGESQYNLNP